MFDAAANPWALFESIPEMVVVVDLAGVASRAELASVFSPAPTLTRTRGTPKWSSTLPSA